GARCFRPLPLLDDIGVRLFDDCPHLAERRAAPVAQLLDLLVYLLGSIHVAILASTASIRAKPPFAPSSTPYCTVVSRSSVVAKRIVCVSFVRPPRSSNSSVCRWFWNVCTSRSGASTSRNSPSTTPKAVRKRYVPPARTSI